MSKTIAVVGASRDPHKISHQAVLAFKQNGYQVFPVNPQAEEIAGLKAYPSLAEISQPLDEISVYLPPALTLDFINQFPEHILSNLQTIYFNPGSFDEQVKKLAEEKGLPAVFACSLIAHNLPSL